MRRGAYLGASARILGSSSGNVTGTELGYLIIDRHVLFFGENSVVCLQFIFIEERLVTAMIVLGLESGNKLVLLAGEVLTQWPGCLLGNRSAFKVSASPESSTPRNLLCWGKEGRNHTKEGIS